MGQPHSGLPILGILALTLAPFSFLLPLFSLPRVCPLRPLPRSLVPSDPLTPDRYRSPQVACKLALEFETP